MAKWRLYISETRRTIWEVEASTPEEGASICLTRPEKASGRVGFIEATIDKHEDITNEAPTAKAAEKFDPLDKKYQTN